MSQQNQNNLASLALDQKKLCNQKFLHTLLWLIAVVLMVFSIFQFEDRVLFLAGFKIEYVHFAIFILILLFIGLAFNFLASLKVRESLISFRNISSQLELAAKNTEISSIEQTISNARDVSKENHLVRANLVLWLPLLNNQMGRLRQAQLQSQLDVELKRLGHELAERLENLKSEVPLIKARANIEASLEFLKLRHDELVTQWKSAYENFSWWNKLNYGDTPDLSEMDHMIDELERKNQLLEMSHSEDFERLSAHFELLQSSATARLSQLHGAASEFIQECGQQERANFDIANRALWLSAFSLPVSMWADTARAGNVYDALRQVNGNFAGMSDTEIWWESLFMPSESLAGLAGLAKGAYFEHLVADDTGGVLFEHFNNPDTDIVIGGVAYQLKATSSEGYVNSGADGIPVIATSEVASSTGVGDSGYSDAELTDTVDLALGGTVIDVGDSIVDSILTGVGGLGMFATIEGINHATTQYQNGGDGVEATFEGLGIAIEGTARAIVGAAEMGFNILSSRPSRFVGRTLLKGLVKLDLVKLNEKSD